VAAPAVAPTAVAPVAVAATAVAAAAVAPAAVPPVAPPRAVTPAAAAPASIPRGDRYEVERRAERSAPVSPAVSSVAGDVAVARDEANVPAEAGAAAAAAAPAPVKPREPAVRPPAPIAPPLARRGRAGSPPRWQQQAEPEAAARAPFRREDAPFRRDEAPFRSERGRDRRDADEGVRFRINWGARDGADPRRILAHVCRRGEIDGRLIGAIEVLPAGSSFVVDPSVATAFAQRVRRPDRRDPHLVITREFTRPARR